MLEKDYKSYSEFRDYLALNLEIIKNVSVYQSNLDGYTKINRIVKDINLYLSTLDFSLKKTLRISDGFIIELENGMWCKLLGDSTDIYGYALYNKQYESTRFILDRENKSYYISRIPKVCTDSNGWKLKLDLLKELA